MGRHPPQPRREAPVTAESVVTVVAGPLVAHRTPGPVGATMVPASPPDGYECVARGECGLSRGTAETLAGREIAGSQHVS